MLKLDFFGYNIDSDVGKYFLSFKNTKEMIQTKSDICINIHILMRLATHK
jgi:hypothetical protein